MWKTIAGLIEGFTEQQRRNGDENKGQIANI